MHFIETDVVKYTLYVKPEVRFIDKLHHISGIEYVRICKADKLKKELNSVA
jgi:hypothetical protein